MPLLEEDKLACVEILEKIGTNVDKVNQNVEVLLQNFKNKKFTLKGGHPLLSLKIQLMMSYMLNMYQMMKQKVKGRSISDSEDVWRMIEIRTVLEKLRPIEQKLKYEIERKTQLALAGDLASNDPLRLKPNPSNLISQTDKSDDDDDDDASLKKADDDDDDVDNKDDDEDEDGGASKPQIYRPPKLVPMFYDGDDTANVRREKAMERARKMAMKSTLMNELRTEFTDQPEEIVDGFGSNRARDRLKEKEKTEYEESYFTRMQMTKKEKMAMKKMQSLSSSAGIWNAGRYSDISILTGDKDDLKMSSGKIKKRPRNQSKGNKKRKKKIKFH